MNLDIIRVFSTIHFTYNKSIDKHSINSVLGVSYTQNESEYLSINATDFPDDFVR